MPLPLAACSPLAPLSQAHSGSTTIDSFDFTLPPSPPPPLPLPTGPTPQLFSPLSSPGNGASCRSGVAWRDQPAPSWANLRQVGSGREAATKPGRIWLASFSGPMQNTDPKRTQSFGQGQFPKLKPICGVDVCTVDMVQSPDSRLQICCCIISSGHGQCLVLPTPAQSAAPGQPMIRAIRRARLPQASRRSKH